MFDSKIADHDSAKRMQKPKARERLSCPIFRSKVASPFSISILVLVCTLLCVVPQCYGQEQRKQFTVTDDINFNHFGDYWTGLAGEIKFSPDGKYFAVYTQRGRPDLNRVEGSLRFYSNQEVDHFLQSPNESQAPSPVWVVNRTQSEGVPFTGWSWAGDSSGVAFLESETYPDIHALMFASLPNKKIERLSLATEDVREFDVPNKRNFVYTVADQEPLRKLEAERNSAAIVGTGLTPDVLFFNPERVPRPNYVLAVINGKRFQVKSEGAPLVATGYKSFALSPDGRVLVIVRAVLQFPPSWEALYPPAYPQSSYYFEYRFHTGGSANEYVRIDMQTGVVQALTDAPVGNDAGWWAMGSPGWSHDGQAILLPGTFLKSKENTPSRPCVAVVDLQSNNSSCVEMLKARTENGGVEPGYHVVKSVKFVDGDRSRVMVSYWNHEDESLVETTEYRQGSDGKWQGIGQNRGAGEGIHNNLEITVKQGFDQPPLLVGTRDKRLSKIIWDPNPQLKNIELGEAIVFTWKDHDGKEQKGGLYKPTAYKPGQRYPLVIQTHAFEQGVFTPSGSFSTAFAARALAGNGIMVLQVGTVGNCPIVTIDEGPCNAAGYELVANKLVSDGLVDPERIGIIGFSRTCFYVMEMLTKGSLHLKAASITDGYMYTYLQYVLWPERMADEAKRTIGAAPFGEGLHEWLKKSPEFNLDKVNTPLLVVGEGPTSMLFMWQPYSGLHSLNKPTEAMMLKDTHEHNLGNPSVRLASQGGSVDWFRFWLKGEEDSDPAKAEQYARWRNLRKLQEDNERKLDVSTIPK